MKACGLWERGLTDERQIRIFLAGGHLLFREAVRVVLDREPDLRVVGEARSGADLLTEIARVRPDVALLDANLANCHLIDLVRMMRERLPDCRILLLATEQNQAALLQAVEAGINGYLTKEFRLSKLIDAARALYRGETLIPGSMLGPLLTQLLDRRRAENDARRQMSRLTHREKEVLALLAQGADNDAIARALFISPQTARTHIQNVLGKLEVHSRLEAAAFVVNNGMLEELVAG